MPFRSKRQIQTCFGKKLLAESKGQKWKWNCERWLAETPNPLCLPSLQGEKIKGCRRLKLEEQIISPVYKGPKGGYFFIAKGVKIYIPKLAINYAKKIYGSNF